MVFVSKKHYHALTDKQAMAGKYIGQTDVIIINVSIWNYVRNDLCFTRFFASSKILIKKIIKGERIIITKIYTGYRCVLNIIASDFYEIIIIVLKVNIDMAAKI
jgi:hypothetical protein